MKITEEQAKAMCYQDAVIFIIIFSFFYCFCVFLPFPLAAQFLPPPLVYILQPMLQIPLGTVLPDKASITTILLYLRFFFLTQNLV